MRELVETHVKVVIQHKGDTSLPFQSTAAATMENKEVGKYFSYWIKLSK